MVRAPLTISTSKTGQLSTTEARQELLDKEVDKRKIELVTEGLSEYIHKQLTELYTVSPQNALTIVNYILTQRTEVKYC